MNLPPPPSPADEPPTPQRPAYGGWDSYGAWAGHDFMDRSQFEDAEGRLAGAGSGGASHSRDGEHPASGKGRRPFVIVLNDPDRVEDGQRLACRIIPESDEDGVVCEPVPAGTADAELALVRPYVQSPARTDPKPKPEPKPVELQLETLISSVRITEEAKLRSLSAIQRKIRALCYLPQSVAEVSAQLATSVDDTQVLINEAIVLGILTVHRSLPTGENGRPTLDLLRRVREGLRKLPA